MGPGSQIPGFDGAQYRHDMHLDDAEEFETEDDIPEEEEDDDEDPV